MCLATVEDATERPLEEGYGWKVFEREGADGRLYSEIRGGEPYQVNRWYEAYELGRVGTAGGAVYQPGFHVFVSRAHARVWSACQTIRRVKWRHYLARGVQAYGGGLNVVVAKEILILPSPRGSR